jgi:hypothetical protein
MMLLAALKTLLANQIHLPAHRTLIQIPKAAQRAIAVAVAEDAVAVSQMGKMDLPTKMTQMRTIQKVQRTRQPLMPMEPPTVVAVAVAHLVME